MVDFTFLILLLNFASGGGRSKCLRLQSHKKYYRYALIRVSMIAYNANYIIKE